jgi:hypothetical protein
MHNVDFIEQGEGKTVILLHSTAAGNKQWRRCCQSNRLKHQKPEEREFYEAIRERHSVRAASQFSLKVLRFESDLCELK